MDFLNAILSNELAIPIVAIVMGCTVAIVAIVAGAIRSVAVNRGREQSRRELAAYVAEGSMDPRTAVAMMNAGRTGDDEDVA